MDKQKVTQLIKEKLTASLGDKNIFSLPKLKKVTLNYRVPDARESQESLNQAQAELVAIAGQKPNVCAAKKSVSSFKLREGDPLALKVTLRGQRMYDFIEKLFNLVLPRLRDFKGMPESAFDQNGSYNLTIKDQTYFPEIDLDKINKIRPLQITLTISASSQAEAKMLLSALGFPFQKN